MKYALPLAMLLLAGCANDHYTVVAGGLGTPSGMSAALSDCRYESMQRAAQWNTHNAARAGVVVGGMIGAVIGVAFDSAAQDDNVDLITKACMADRGYSTTSAN